jgi:hypothetical protein
MRQLAPGKDLTILRGLYYSGFIGIDKDGNLAITEDGMTHLKAAK